jgi:hypothetical protein
MVDVAMRADEEWWERLPSPAPDDAPDVAQEVWAARPSANFADAQARLALELRVAAETSERDPDAAALVLDGMLWRIIHAWYAAIDFPAPRAGNLLLDLEQRAPELAWRLRLALRAPDAGARLAHARHVLAACAADIVARLALNLAAASQAAPLAREASCARSHEAASAGSDGGAADAAPRKVKEIRHDVR